MSAFITALTDSTTGVTASGLWTAIADAVPFIVIMFGVAVGYRIIRKLIKSGSKLKVNV